MTARTGHIAISMADWNGNRTATKYLDTWADVLRFVRSDEFTLMRDIRLLTFKQLAPPARTIPGGPPRSHWKPSPEQAAALEEHGQREFTCIACGATPGKPCTAVDPGRAVHTPRWVAAKKAAVAEAARRTPEQLAAQPGDRGPAIIPNERTRP